MKVAVVGAGTMGNGIAHVFAQAGWNVTLIDVSAPALEGALATIRKNLERLLKKGTVTESERDATLGRIETSSDLRDAKGADLVVEAATEAPELKFRLFRELDSIAGGEAILATNTSSISITEIAAQTKHPERVIGMHFMNPVPLMPLVEVIRGDRKSVV